MASWWSITVPAQFQDITSEATQQPAFEASLDKIRGQGGAASAKFWSSEDTVVLALDASFSGMPDSLAVLEGFENGARKTSYGTGKEHSYTSQKDAHFIISQQHATSSAGELMWTHRWTGGGTDGALRSLGVVCTGNEATCKGVLASVRVDPASFVTLSSLPSGGGNRLPYMIGYAVGVALVCALFVGVYAKVRERKRALARGRGPSATAG